MMYYFLLKHKSDIIITNRNEKKLFKKQNNIVFKVVDPGYIEIFDPPVPAKKEIPEWYKKQHKYTNGSHLEIGDNGNPNHTIKSCMPVFDILTSGYLIKTPVDIYIEKLADGSIKSHWSSNQIVAVEWHPVSQFNEFKIPEGYHQSAAFKFIQPWVIETPPGYSCIFMQPALREGLPFEIIPAIVDTDKHPIKINFPFFIKEDFEGLIPTGTPIAQIIPFKRENWAHKVEEDLSGSGKNKWSKAENKIGNRYKTFFRTVKRWD